MLFLKKYNPVLQVDIWLKSLRQTRGIKQKAALINGSIEDIHRRPEYEKVCYVGLPEKTFMRLFAAGAGP